MAGHIRVDTDQVAQIASTIESLNQKLFTELQETAKLVASLADTWQGQASQATIDAYKEFEAKYFQTYYDIIDNYVKFLRVQIDQGYFQTESTNTGLADAFK